jgi:hypothetical protein
VPPISTACIGYYGPTGNAGTVMLPITLGQAFMFSETASVNTGIRAGGFPAGDNAGADVSFRLFEADGMTPAQMFVAPEPAALALLGGGSWRFLLHRDGYTLTSSDARGPRDQKCFSCH